MSFSKCQAVSSVALLFQQDSDPLYIPLFSSRTKTPILSPCIKASLLLLVSTSAVLIDRTEDASAGVLFFSQEINSPDKRPNMGKKIFLFFIADCFNDYSGVIFQYQCLPFLPALM